MDTNLHSDPFFCKGCEYLPVVRRLNPGDVVEVTLESVMQQSYLLLCTGMFTFQKIYTERIIPKFWRDKLKFWKWFKKKVIFVFVFKGSKNNA